MPHLLFPLILCKAWSLGEVLRGMPKNEVLRFWCFELVLISGPKRLRHESFGVLWQVSSGIKFPADHPRFVFAILKSPSQSPLFLPYEMGCFPHWTPLIKFTWIPISSLFWDCSYFVAMTWPTLLYPPISACPVPWGCRNRPQTMCHSCRLPSSPPTCCQKYGTLYRSRS